MDDAELSLGFSLVTWTTTVCGTRNGPRTGIFADFRALGRQTRHDWWIETQLVQEGLGDLEDVLLLGRVSCGGASVELSDQLHRHCCIERSGDRARAMIRTWCATNVGGAMCR